jgi:aldehyde:ferredoxin oxidoreductase
MYGNTGKLLRVDLSNKSISILEPKESDYRKFIGGSGLAAKMLYYDFDISIDPLDERQPIFFMAGPLTGTKVPNSGRHQVVGKSPATGIYGEANSGGYWGAELKYAGYDGVIVVGKAPEPVYLWIHDDEVKIKEAEPYWGKDTYEINDPLLQNTHEKARVLAIGQAGENLVPMAAVMNDGPAARCAARTGLGALMGSKKLKAIVVRGTKKVPVAEPEKLQEYMREMAKAIRNNPTVAHMHQAGTSGSAMVMESKGDLPTKNWTVGAWPEGGAKISSLTQNSNIETKHYYCKGCVIGCGKEINIKEGKYQGTIGGAPEYESVASLGSYCLLDDIEAICKANELCNRYGVDTISAGGAIAFAMEAFERGDLTLEDTGGLALEWGNADVVMELIRKIAFREGIGEVLAQGVKKASEQLKGLSMEYAVHVKGLELPAHDPRSAGSLAVSYATSNRGACHLQGQSSVYESFVTDKYLGIETPMDRFADDGKGELSAKAQNLGSLFDSLCLCKYLAFGGVEFSHVVKFFNLVTGWNFTEDELFKTGERIFNLKRLYNVDLGISRKDDMLPPRIQSLMFKEGGAAGHLPNLGVMLNEYYDYRGWDEFGIPTKEKMEDLELEWK